MLDVIFLYELTKDVYICTFKLLGYSYLYISLNGAMTEGSSLYKIVCNFDSFRILDFTAGNINAIFVLFLKSFYEKFL